MTHDELAVSAFSLTWLAGAATGLLSILAALLRRKPLSQWCSQICKFVALASVVVCMFVGGERIPLIAYILVTAPAGLGFIGDLIRQRQPDGEPLPVGQFSIAIVLFITTVIAMVLGVVAAIPR